MTYVSVQLFPYIFVGTKKFVGTIIYEPLVGFHSNFKGCSLGIYDDIINFWDESIKDKMATLAI